MVRTVPVIAEEAGEGLPGLGVGGESCNVFMSTYEHNPDSLDEHHMETGDEGPHHKTSYTSADYIHWLQGYLSAYSVHNNDRVDVSRGASTGGMLYFLYRRCSEDPDASFSSMMPALLERLDK